MRRKPRIEFIMLLLILAFVAFPYLMKGYQAFLESRRQEKARIASEKREADNQKILQENQKGEALLTKYNIRLLEKEYPPLEKDNQCSNSMYECRFNLMIPDALFAYLIGEIKDKKFGSDVQCEKIKNKYIRLCPSGEYFCDIREDLESERNKYREILDSEPLEPTPTPSQLDFLIIELQKKGYNGSTNMSVQYGEGIDGYYRMKSRCDRLNFENHFIEFEKEIPNIEKMISQNKGNKMVVNFNTNFFRNYLLLKNELNDIDVK